MAENRTHNQETMSEDVAENSGARTAAIDSNPDLSLEETRNASAGEGPNAAGGSASSTAEDYVPSRSDPSPSNIASTDHLVPEEAENSDEETAGASNSFSAETGDRYAH